MKPLVSAVIVNYNGKKVIGEAIQSLTSQDYKRIEIIVVDNNSSDGSQKFIMKNYDGVKLVQNKKNLGYCGINKGLKQCGGKYIFFTNNDISMERNCIRKLVELCEKDKEIGIASSKVVNYFDRKLKSCGTWVSRSFYNGHFKCDKDSVKEIPYNGVALIRKDIVEKFGYLFDEDYFVYAEDLDLGLRTRLLGYKTVHVPDAVLYHMHEYTLGASKSHMLTFLMERNLLYTFIKVLSAKNITFFLPYVILMRAVAITKDMFILKFANAGARILAMLSVMLNLPSLIQKRRLVQRLRKKDDSFLLQAFSEKFLFSSKKINV